MTIIQFDTLDARDFANGAILEEIRNDIKIADLYRSALLNIEPLLKEVEQHCPCGARPESLRTHPHVLGCKVEQVLTIIKHTKDAETGIKRIKRKR